MRKKFLSIALIFALFLFISGCSVTRTDITQEEIVAAYEEAGYEVWSRAYDEKLDHGEIAYVQADHPDGDYIYFSIFENEKDAKAYKEEYYHPVMMGLFSVIFGEPSWQRWEVYGCILVQYDDSDFFDPFRELLKGNEKSS